MTHLWVGLVRLENQGDGTKPGYSDCENYSFYSICSVQELTISKRECQSYISVCWLYNPGHMLLLYFTTCQLFILVCCKRLSLRKYIVHMFLCILQSFHHLLYFIGLQNPLLQRLHSPYASYIFKCQSFIICYYITIESAAETLESICFLGILLFVSHLL